MRSDMSKGDGCQEQAWAPNNLDLREKHPRSFRATTPTYVRNLLLRFFTIEYATSTNTETRACSAILFKDEAQ